jgi:hypothetical protein
MRRIRPQDAGVSLLMNCMQGIEGRRRRIKEGTDRSRYMTRSRNDERNWPSGRLELMQQARERP